MVAKSLIIKKEKCFHNSSWLPAPLSFIWQRFHFIVRLELNLWEVGYGAEYLSGIQCWKIQIAKFSALFRMRNDFLSLWVKRRQVVQSRCIKAWKASLPPSYRWIRETLLIHLIMAVSSQKLGQIQMLLLYASSLPVLKFFFQLKIICWKPIFISPTFILIEGT